ncbi:MAG: secretin N-terminal domain-containing protein [Planctomycetota bacterium]
MTYDPRETPNPAVSVRGSQPLDTSTVWQVIYDSLALSDRVIVATGDNADLYSIMDLAEASQRVRAVSVREFEQRRGVSNFFKVRMPIESMAMETIEDLARATTSASRSTRGAAAAASMELIAATNEIFVAGRAVELELFLGLVDDVRELEGDIVIETLAVPRGSGEDIIASVQEVAELRSSLSARTLRGRLLPGGDGASVVLTAPSREAPVWRSLVNDVIGSDRTLPQSYSIAGIAPERLEETFEAALIAEDPGRVPLRAFANPLTGVLTVWTDQSGHAVLDQIVNEATNPDPKTKRSLATIPIRHRDAEGLVSDVEAALSAITGASIESVESVPQLIGAAEANDPLDPRSSARIGGSESASSANRSISVDEETNSLLVVGTPIEIEQIRTLVAELDVPTTQVRIEVLLLSLTESQTLDLGIELDKIEITGGTTFRLSSLFGLGLQAGSAVLPGAGAGLTGVVLDPGDFSVLIQALETVNDGRTLSMPSVLVSNNQTADFNSVLQQPVVSINASDTVATTSFGGFEDAGTNISVDPQILAGDRLILDYSVTLSSFVGESSDPSSPPPRQQNQLSSSVTIPDGYTVSLGGIELTTEGEGESRIPLLGSIPWLGVLFKTRSISDSRTRFYVFIRANIYRDPMLERLRYASESLASELALPSDWPVIEPRVMR